MTDATKNPSGKKAFEVPLYIPPAQKAERGQPVELPTVEAPSLEGLSVTVPAPESFTVEQVQARFEELARPFATERARSPEEEIAWGDEVLLNIVGYSNGKILPFSVRTNVWLPLFPEPMLPGFYETLVGHSPGASLVVDIELAAEYPVESLQGAPARFLVDIQAAREVTYPDPEDPAFLQAFGRGKTLDEATRSVVAQMEEEHAQLLLLQAQQLVLNEVAERTQVEIPESLIDEEIRRRWGATEGRSLAELDFTEEEQEESLQTWLKDPETRLEAEQRLKVGLALGAICKRDKLTLTPEYVEKVLSDEARSAGLTLDEAAQALRAEPQHLARIDQVAWHLMAVDYVMKKAKIRFEGA
jgi:trigger factor